MSTGPALLKRTAPAEVPGGIYLDHHATTPVDQDVAQAMLNYMSHDFGNASSVDHVYGERAAAAVEDAANAVAELLYADPSDVHFTSGSTQAIELAFAHALGTARGLPLRLALSRTEHPAVIDTATRAERRGLATILWIEVLPDGSLDMDGLRSLVATGVDLLCVMAANNEVGTVYPVASVYEIANAAGVPMLVDATQAAGRVHLDLSATPFDYLILSGHKMYGPKGIGALVSSIYRPEDNFGIAASHRATQNVPAIVGFGMACRLMATRGKEDDLRIRGLRDVLLAELRAGVPDIVVNGGAETLAGNLHVSAPGAMNDLVVAHLRNKVAISTGAACMSGAQGASHVLQAMGLRPHLQDSALRIGLGRHTTLQDVLVAAREIASAISTVRRTLEGSHA